jgi:hypothetical protein
LFCLQELQRLRTYMLHELLFVEQSVVRGQQSMLSVVA